MPQYWLFKSEPVAFSIDDLAKSPRQTTCWEGVRNYQARNFLRSMKVGDLGFFYHSNADPPAIVGIIKIVKAAYPDNFAFDSKSRYFDPRSAPDSPRWFLVDVRLVRRFSQALSLEQLRSIKGLEKMELLRKGSRLSVQPVRPEEWQRVLQLIPDKKMTE
jgi:predicted RNA-binding protein with PUA-like domain